MGICKQCKNINLCKYYDKIKDMVGLTVEIKECIYRINDGVAETAPAKTIDRPRRISFSDYSSIPEITADELSKCNNKVAIADEMIECADCKGSFKKKELTKTIDLATRNEVYTCDKCFGYGAENTAAWDIKEYMNEEKTVKKKTKK